MYDARRRTRANSAHGPSETDVRVTVRAPGLLSAGSVICAVLAVYFLIEAFAPFSVFRLLLAIVTATLGVRLAIRGTLIATADGIEWHTMMRHAPLAVCSGESLRSGRQARRCVWIL